jgi:hypothetical protein
MSRGCRQSPALQFYHCAPFSLVIAGFLKIAADLVDAMVVAGATISEWSVLEV